MHRDIALVHGGGQGSWIWDDMISAIRLQDGSMARKIVALDVPGCGTKRDRDRDLSAVRHADVIRELGEDLDRAGVRDALLVGHSQAGTVLPRLAAARRDRIASTLYVTCCAPAKGQTVAQMMGTAVHGADPEAVGWPRDPATTPPHDLFRAMFCNDMDEAAGQQFLEALGADRWPDGCALEETEWDYAISRDVPASYLVTLRDAILPPEWQQRFAERIGVMDVLQIDAGHQPMNTRPHGLAEIVRSLAAL